MIGMALKWIYKDFYVNISIPKYVQKALEKFSVTESNKYKAQPHKYTQLKYG